MWLTQHVKSPLIMQQFYKLRIHVQTGTIDCHSMQNSQTDLGESQRREVRKSVGKDSVALVAVQITELLGWKGH